MEGSRLNTFNSAQFVHWYPESRARRILSHVCCAIPGVLNPYARVIQGWNKFFLVSCLLAIFLDPLFFFSLSLQQDNKCMVIDWPITTPLLVLRSMNDLVYLTHMLLQFRLAYVAGESVVGAGELVDHPKQIALKYLSGYFLVDFFILLPLPQIIITLVLPKFMVSFAGNYEKTLLGAVLLLQYVPRLYRFLHSFSAQYPSGFILESTWKTSIINLFGFGLSGHVVGSCWYIFGLQRVVQCLQDACHSSGMDNCQRFIDCRQANYVPKFESDSTRESWKRNENVTACFSEGGYSGIYVQAVNLTRERNPVTRYAYSFFWGFQQISTLAGNQNPSYFLFEVLFAIAIIGLGLFLLQNLLQSLSRSRNFSREVKLSQRRHDVEHWMSHWRLPAELRREVRQSERYRLIATRGINEERLLENLPEDLQREIRWHRSKFIKKVRVFSFMDEPILDAVRERLRQKTYIKGNRILDYGVFMDKMVFIIRGKMESIGENGLTPLREGDVCGEELLTWCFEHSHVEEDERKIRFPGLDLLSKRRVICLTNVEVFVLLAADLQDIFSHFSRFLRNPRVQHAIRYESPYWRSWAAAHIQRAWRYRQRQLRGADTSIVQPNQQINGGRPGRESPKHLSPLLQNSLDRARRHDPPLRLRSFPGARPCLEDLGTMSSDTNSVGKPARAPSVSLLPSPLEEGSEEVESDNDDVPVDTMTLDAVKPDLEMGHVATRTVELDEIKTSSRLNNQTTVGDVNKLGRKVTGTSERSEAEGCTILDVMNILGSLPGVTPGDSLFMLGTRLFIRSEEREMFVALGDSELRLQWLRQEQLREDTHFTL